ncbi:hypothetical protein BB8028_0003g03760 [Beauveria bassiana]|uniref:F-box domain-containing protein n=1 Tax=Beauveria bassiana TaxID=176275 RepID=A0A2S7Y7C2_BEABA|nr:hypothetical protein BB8028_0003g03760 [Beauveria bassiana]
MDTSQQISFSAAIAEWLSNSFPAAALNFPQDAASDLPQNAASHIPQDAAVKSSQDAASDRAQYAASNLSQNAVSDLPPGDDVEGAEVHSPNSQSSTATTFYDVYSDGPNLPNLPVEIFGMIISQISRQDVRNLRVVCKLCEANASPYYFKNVVVPFRTQMLRSISPDRVGKLQNLSNSMLSNGGRIFGEFGHIIRRFALSLELDEDTLEYPPQKPKQQVIRSYWGLYRWPHATYSRYQEVSGIENVADEFLHMKAALRCLSHVTELGLCSDAGLGFLSGPNIRARYNAIRHRVFHDTYGERNKISLGSTPPSVVTVGDALPASGDRSQEAGSVLQNWKMSMMEAMLRDAGFEEGELLDALALLLKTEGKTSLADMDFAASHTPSIPKERIEVENWDLLPAFYPIRSSLSWSLDKQPPKRTDYALVPAALTLAQKEMLLELEWAHRAMAQSFILSAIDCSIEGSFQYVTTLNIAKIPSSHLHILSRHDLWSSFPSLTSVSLGVVADWRRFHVYAPEMVDEVSVSPLDAVPLAHALIKDYISVEPKIESFHFEWICGGELATGCHQRSQHILPAPFVASPATMARPAMANVGTDSALLRLPYVKHLSLKNCWAAPHVLLQSLRDYALCSLERVEFEGVSLSVMPWITADPPPHDLVDLGTGLTAANVIMLNSPELQDELLSLKQPSWMSWAGLIEHFSPSAKIRDAIDCGEDATVRASSAQQREDMLEVLTRIIPDARELSMEETLYALESLTFKSCGYVNLDHERFHLASMITTSELSLLSATLPTVSEFTPFMQRCNKKLVGRIVNVEMQNDKVPFERVFNFTMGWQGVYDGTIIDAAEADNCQRLGLGRFSGHLAKDVGV